MTIIGVIADTHGLLRPEALEAMRGSDLILHAGDIGKREILKALERIAPVTAVRGNVDPRTWREIPMTQVIEVGSLLLYMLHNIAELDLVPKAAGIAAVVYGHSHQPSAKKRDGVLYFNPGSAGPRRFRLPVSVGRIVVDGGKVMARLITLKIREGGKAGSSATKVASGLRNLS